MFSIGDKSSELDGQSSDGMQCLLFASSHVIVTFSPIESHSGAWGNILAGPLYFEFLKILVYFIFLSDGRPPNVTGPGVAYPLPHSGNL